MSILGLYVSEIAKLITVYGYLQIYLLHIYQVLAG